MRILILRPDNIGDVVLFSGALQHIRNLYPDAHICLAVKAHIVNLLELCPFVDVCIAVDSLTWWGKVRGKFGFNAPRIEFIVYAVNKLWNYIIAPYDMIIYPVKSAQVKDLSLIKYLNAKKVSGMCGCTINSPERGYPPDVEPGTIMTDCLDVTGDDPWRHELETTFDFLRFIGCSVDSLADIKPQFWISKFEKNHLQAVLNTGKRIVGLVPSATFKQKFWQPDNYGTFVQQLLGDYVYVILGGCSDSEFNGKVELSINEKLKDANVINLTGLTTLRELIVAIKSCDILVGIDTSGLHIGIAVDIPTIGIIGGGHFGRFVPWGDANRHVFFSHKMPCFQCGWVCSHNNIKCIDEVSPHEISDCAIALMTRNNEIVQS